MLFDPTSLGGGKKGATPLLFKPACGSADRAISRRQLVKSFGNLVIPGLKNNGVSTSPALYSNNILGSFRTAMNAGDVITNTITPTNIKYGRESNKINGNNLSRLNPVGDGVSQNGMAMYSGNPRHVYDGSDYARFKRLQAINRNFNDKSHGGDNSSASQSVIRHVRS